MSWNHRLLAHENNGEIYFQLHEVYYKDGIPYAYTFNGVTIGAESVKDIAWTLDKMKEAIKKPIIWAGEKFPSEPKISYECLHCGRNKFTRKQGHTCNGQFRKRKLQWKLKYN